MRKNHVKIIALAFALQIVLPDAGGQAVAQAGKAAYPAMAPLDQYLISDEKSEIALARSAAPGFYFRWSRSDGAGTRRDIETAVKGTNGFLCIVERVVGGRGTDQEGVLESEDACTPCASRVPSHEETLRPSI